LEAPRERAAAAPLEFGAELAESHVEALGRESSLALAGPPLQGCEHAEHERCNGEDGCDEDQLTTRRFRVPFGPMTWAAPCQRPLRSGTRTARNREQVRKRLAAIVANRDRGVVDPARERVATQLRAWLVEMRRSVRPSTWRS
jgi:hypothetical protein